MSEQGQDFESDVMNEINKYDRDIARYFQYIRRLNEREKGDLLSLIQRLNFILEQEKKFPSRILLSGRISHPLTYFLLGIIMGISLVIIFKGIW